MTDKRPSYMKNRRQFYMTDAEHDALKALSKRYGLVRVVNGVKTPNLSKTVVRAVQECLNETV